MEVEHLAVTYDVDHAVNQHFLNLLGQNDILNSLSLFNGDYINLYSCVINGYCSGYVITLTCLELLSNQEAVVHNEIICAELTGNSSRFTLCYKLTFSRYTLIYKNLVHIICYRSRGCLSISRCLTGYNCQVRKCYRRNNLKETVVDRYFTLQTGYLVASLQAKVTGCKINQCRSACILYVVVFTVSRNVRYYNLAEQTLCTVCQLFELCYSNSLKFYWNNRNFLNRNEDCILCLSLSVVLIILSKNGQGIVDCYIESREFLLLT